MYVTCVEGAAGSGPQVTGGGRPEAADEVGTKFEVARPPDIGFAFETAVPGIGTTGFEAVEASTRAWPEVGG